MVVPEPAAGVARTEEIFANLKLSASARKRAAEALVRVVDARIREAVAVGVPVVRYPVESLGGGVERAENEGETLKRDTLSRPGMLAPAEAAARIGITRQALDDRRKKNLALALSHSKRGFRYPAWQFDENLAEAMKKVLPALSWLDPWERYFLLVQPEPLLGGRSPLEVLRAGEQDRVLQIIGLLHKDQVA
jgi:hypothetical protein